MGSAGGHILRCWRNGLYNGCRSVAPCLDDYVCVEVDQRIVFRRRRVSQAAHTTGAGRSRRTASIHRGHSTPQRSRCCAVTVRLRIEGPSCGATHDGAAQDPDSTTHVRAGSGNGRQCRSHDTCLKSMRRAHDMKRAEATESSSAIARFDDACAKGAAKKRVAGEGGDAATPGEDGVLYSGIGLLGRIKLRPRQPQEFQPMCRKGQRRSTWTT